jgi:hypothetical protein
VDVAHRVRPRSIDRERLRRHEDREEGDDSEQDRADPKRATRLGEEGVRFASGRVARAGRTGERRWRAP